MAERVNQPASTGLSRREILGGFLGVSALGAVGVLAVKNRVDENRKELDATIADIQALGDVVVEPEALDLDDVIPEHRRNAGDVLVATSYDESLWRSDAIERMDAIFGPMLRALPDYATLHLVGPKSLAGIDFDGALGRKVQVYPCFNGAIGSQYIQDVGEATGKMSPEGRFELISTFCNRDWLRRTEVCGRRMNYPVGEIQYKGVRDPDPYFMDDILATKYPERFKVTYLDVLFQGGNTSFSELPSGEKCVFVSKTDLGQFMSTALCLPEEGSVEQSTYELAKAAYQRAFGTTRVVVMDEDQFIKDLKREGLLAATLPGQFFHNDMTFNTHRVDKEMVAFVSDVPSTLEVFSDFNFSGLEDIAGSLDRIRQQLEALGYKVVRVPFITNELNFINGITYTDRKTGAPNIVLPYYHFPEDETKGRYIGEVQVNPYAKACFEMARGRYEGAGVEVRAAEYSRGNYEALAAVAGGNAFSGVQLNSGNRGGFHCRVQLLS